MTLRKFTHNCFCVLVIVLFSNCNILHEGSKYSFSDGKYRIKVLNKKEVYVLKVDEDTIAVFPVLEFHDSTAILTDQRLNYTSLQRKFKDNKTSHSFYRPSFDIDVMTIAAKYRPPSQEVPSQFTTTFNGAVFAGYRIDAYKLNYKRTPLNIYKQHVKHLGYCAGFYTGIGNTPVNGTVLNQVNNNIEYEGIILIAGIASNIAVENVTFGLSFGFDHLLDANQKIWVYQGRPNVGFTLGLNIN